MEQKEVFPFMKLPRELQLMVIRFAMPSNGMHPLNRKLSNKNEAPVSLFRTSKSLSAMALPIFYNEVPLYIDISPHVISYSPESLRRWVGTRNYLFQSHLSIRKLQQFRVLRKYRFNLVFEPCWFDAKPEDRADDYSAYCRLFKEQLRVVCDTLTGNEAIQELVVTIPCLCLLDDGLVAQAYPEIIDFLSPLHRIKVAKPVVFETTYQDRNSNRQETIWPISCRRTECNNLAQSIQASMGHLNGKELTSEEQTWKRIKELDHGNPHILREESIRLLGILWEFLNSLQDTYWEYDKYMFAEYAERTEDSMQKDYKYRVWERKEAQKRRLRSFLRLGEGDSQLKSLWPTERAMEHDALSKRTNRTPEEQQRVLQLAKEFRAKQDRWAFLVWEWNKKHPPISDFDA
ncbi:MAG: hypothetical protein Q9166_002427 [cf. Caloplaca sp. 2 TL-2023]